MRTLRGREVVDRVGARRPHLGVGVAAEEPLLHGRGQLPPLAALQGHDLLATAGALRLRLPGHAAVIGAGPPAVVDDDLRAGPHQVVEQQGEGQADGTAAGDGHPQHRRADARHHGRAGLGGRGGGDLQPEDLVADRDLVTRADAVAADAPPVHRGAVGAPAVVERPAPAVGAQLGVVPGGQPGGEDHVVVRAATHRQRRRSEVEALSCQLAVDPHEPHDVPFARIRFCRFHGWDPRGGSVGCARGRTASRPRAPADLRRRGRGDRDHPARAAAGRDRQRGRRSRRGRSCCMRTATTSSGSCSASWSSRASGSPSTTP